MCDVDVTFRVCWGFGLIPYLHVNSPDSQFEGKTFPNYCHCWINHDYFQSKHLARSSHSFLHLDFVLKMSRLAFAAESRRDTVHALRLSSVTAEQWKSLSAATAKFGDDAHRVVSLSKGLDTGHYVYYLPAWLDRAICSFGQLAPVEPQIREDIIAAVNEQLAALSSDSISECALVVPFRMTKVYCSSCTNSLNAAFLDQFDSKTSRQWLQHCSNIRWRLPPRRLHTASCRGVGPQRSRSRRSLCLWERHRHHDARRERLGRTLDPELRPS